MSETRPVTRRFGPLRAEAAVLVAAAVGFALALWAVQRHLWSTRVPPGALTAPDASPALATAAGVVLLGVLACALAAWVVVRAAVFARAGLAGLAGLLLPPAAAAVVVTLLPPTLSDDVLAYLSHGWLATTPGRNPYVDNSSPLDEAAYGQDLLRNGYYGQHPPTCYGPLWTLVERTIRSVTGDDVGVGMLLLKVIALLALPLAAPLVVHLVATRRSWRGAVGAILLGSVVIAGAGVLLIAPYWRGVHTFAGLGAAAPLGWSIPALLTRALGRALGAAAARSAAQSVAAAALVVGTVVLSVLERRVGLRRAAALVALLVVVLLPYDEPWYGVTPSALLTLLPDVFSLILLAVLAVASRVTAPFADLIGAEVLAGQRANDIGSLLGQLVPGAVAVVLLLRTRRRRLLSART